VNRAVSLASLLLAAPLAAQTPDHAAPLRPIASALRVEASPMLDGHLDDAAWAGAPVLTGFVQHEPFDGTPATERTEVRIVFDREAIYIGARLFDRDPGGIVHGEVRRDVDLKEQDAFIVVLDTYRDHQNGFVFGTTPAGIEHDGQITKEGEGGFGGPSSTPRNGQTGAPNLNWDGTWRVVTSVDSAGWTAEFRIPFETLRYGGGKIQEWGLNLARYIRRNNEEDFWSPIPRQYSLYRVSQAGTLAQLEPPSRRIALVTPYALGTLRRDFEHGETTDLSAQFGGDAKLGVTQSLTADLTYHTDFAQVEVDEEQINLTRFNLFFPEKRPFFLENAGTFAVGTPQSVELFFSRRIGIAADGREVPLVGGGRLTGKAAGLTLGLLDIQAERVDGAGTLIPANNYSMARVLKELPHRSQVGVIAVSRLNTDSSADYNVTLGADARIGIGDVVNLDAWAAHTETPSRPGSSNAVNLAGSYTTRNWELGLAARQVDRDFNPEVGFLERETFRYYTARILRHLRTPNISWFREVRPHITFRQYDDTEGRPQSRLIHIDDHVLFANGAFFEFPGLNFIREALQQPFAIAENVTLQPRIYDWFEFTTNFNTNLSARYSVTGVFTAGQFYTGHHTSLQSTWAVRPNEKVLAAFRMGYEDVRLKEGDFTRVLLGFRLAYSFTPSIYLQSLTQYNNQSRTLSANVRFGWLGPAGTGLFLVFNEGRETGENARPLDRAFVVKFTRQFDLGK
jgi:hypothetical protein